jgi:hypothetical protein
MPGAVAMLADSGAQSFYFRDQLAFRQVFKVFVHKPSFI